LQALFAVIGHPDTQQHIRKTHDAQSDFTRFASARFDLGQWEFIHIDHIIQETHRQMNSAGHFGPVDFIMGALADDHARKIERPQVAGFIGQQGLLPAGIGAFDFAQLGGGIIAVDTVDENNPGIACLPGAVDYLVVDFFGIQLAGRFAVMRVDQVIVSTLFNRFHKFGGNRHR